MLYQAVVILHVVSLLGFLLAHGASANISFALKKERDIQHIRSYLNLSGESYPAMMGTLLAVVVFGLIAAFLDMEWWRTGWLWASISVLAVIIAVMAHLGSGMFSQVRKAAGLAYRYKGKSFPAEAVGSDEQVHAALAKVHPSLLLITGYGGIAVIAWLMVVKPF